MPFSFLSPWFWLGALALAAPIWLHLRRRKPTNLVLFSTLRFLDDSPQPRQSPLRLRDILLFVLRCLALLLIVLAFTWPFIKSASTTPIRESRVYILDNTLSRQVNKAFEADRERLGNELSKAGPEVQIGIVELTSTPRTLVTLGDTRESALEKIQALKPSFERGSFLAAFRQASTLLANSLGEKKRLIFLSDNQENQWSEHVSAPAFLKSTSLEMPKISKTEEPNLSLADARVQRIFLGEKSLVNFTVRLSHSGPAKAATVVLTANGQQIFNRQIDLAKEAETTLLHAQWEAPPGQWLQGKVSVEGTPDSLPADNIAFFSLAPVVEGKVALLTQSTYLRVALSPEIMRGQWSGRMLDPGKLAAELSGNRDADVLCLESSYLQSTDARKLLQRYLSNGRGAVLLINRLTPTITGALRELGLESEGFAQFGADQPQRIAFFAANHPVFHPFVSPDYGNLVEVAIQKHARIKGPEAMPLVFSEHGSGLFFQSLRFPGKLFVVAFGLDREHTNWPVHQTFIPFLDLVLQAARAEDPTPLFYEPGQVAMLQVPPGGFTNSLVLLGGQLAQKVPVTPERVQVRLPNAPGLYRLQEENATEPLRIFCVNPPSKESRLTYLSDPEPVKLWQVNAGSENARTAALPHARFARSAVLQQRLWWWMLLGGLGLLMIEMVLADRKMEPV